MNDTCIAVMLLSKFQQIAGLPDTPPSEAVACLLQPCAWPPSSSRHYKLPCTARPSAVRLLVLLTGVRVRVHSATHTSRRNLLLDEGCYFGVSEDPGAIYSPRDARQGEIHFGTYNVSCFCHSKSAIGPSPQAVMKTMMCEHTGCLPYAKLSWSCCWYVVR
jgi:hypothetical protein